MASHAISATVAIRKSAAINPRAGYRQNNSTTHAIAAAAATLWLGGPPAANDRPSLRAGGSSHIRITMAALAPQCEAIRAQTALWASAKLASAPARSNKAKSNA